MAAGCRVGLLPALYTAGKVWQGIGIYVVAASLLTSLWITCHDMCKQANARIQLSNLQDSGFSLCILAWGIT